MKISKQSKTAVTDVECCSNTCHQSAVDYIMKAIEELGSVADTDETAKDAIVNLSVILLDLQ